MSPTARREGGWALLGVLLALAVIGIVMSSAIVPNVRVQVQRDKEAEMRYRGEQMSEGIARYYNGGRLAGIQLLVPPPYGFLTDMNKLRDGVRLNVRELKFVRPSAMLDPMQSIEWEPVRARDPRIMPFLQAWAAETMLPIPNQYLLIAGPPQKLHRASPSDEFNEGETPAPPPAAGSPGQKVPPPPPPRPNDEDEDDEDDEGDDGDEGDGFDEDDETPNDPLKHLFDTSEVGKSNVPIVAVAPRVKGKALRPLYGLENYEEWIFLFIPDPTRMSPIIPRQPQQPQRPGPRGPRGPISK